MSPLPIMSVRCPKEHQKLIRDIVRSLRFKPELAGSIATIMAGNDPQLTITQPVLADITMRLEAVERWIAERNAIATHSNATPADNLDTDPSSPLHDEEEKNATPKMVNGDGVIGRIPGLYPDEDPPPRRRSPI